MSTAGLSGKRVLVTGATGTIGRCVATELADHGASLALVARSAEPLERLRTNLPSGDHHVFAFDVRDAAAWAENSSELSPAGDLHGLVCAAGTIGPIGPIGSWAVESFRAAIDVNLTGALLAVMTNLDALRHARGSVVVISGGGATAPFPRFDAYAASKAALVRLCENLARELVTDGVRCNAVAPGFVESPMHADERAAGPEVVGADYYERSVRARESGGDPPELAAALVSYLLSPSSAPVTGKLIAAKWDPWQEDSFKTRCIEDPDFATLRRIDDQGFFDKVR